MAEKDTRFQTFLKEEVDRVKGIYYPVRAGLPRRLLIRHASWQKMHPNPDDEFCYPEIGPNYEIISRYEQEFRQDFQFANGTTEGTVLEPILVQKAKPDGYLILNGHHRWAAAMRAGVHRLRIQIVNLTQVADIRKMLENSQSDKRVTLDLDEVVFCSGEESFAEKPLRFPFNRLYKERIRKGIPALLHAFNEKDCDIWVYSSKYYSMEYIRAFFRHWNVRLTGIVTGTEQKGALAAENKRKMKKMLETKYASTFYIDNDMMIRTMNGSRECEEFRMSGNPATWAREAMEILEKISARRQG